MQPATNDTPYQTLVTEFEARFDGNENAKQMVLKALSGANDKVKRKYAGRLNTNREYATYVVNSICDKAIRFRSSEQFKREEEMLNAEVEQKLNALNWTPTIRVQSLVNYEVSKEADGYFWQLVKDMREQIKYTQIY